MSTDTNPSFDNLPVELLYQILHLLDSSTILLSFRYVCKRFHHLTNVYNRYRLNFHQSSKGNFYRFCRILQPSLVQRLNLSDDHQTPGQIALFLRFFNFNQFTSLRSLSLVEIGDSTLNSILQDLSLPSLQSLTIQSRSLFTWTPSTLSSLSNILQLSSLRSLTLSIWCFEIYDFLWPHQCLIGYLDISSRITFEQYCIILERCPSLTTFMIKDVLWNDPNIVLSESYSHLKSLTLADNRMDISRLEQFLSLTPSLIYLKVIGMAYLDDSHQWERILRTKLSNLERFEFFFLSWKHVNYDLTNIQSFIQPYQTPFWLETKNWLVNCDYILHPAEVMLYTLPICKNDFHYHPYSNKISCTNNDKVIRTDYSSTSTNNITTLRINLVKIFAREENRSSLTTPLFASVRNLIIDLDDQCPSEICTPILDLVHLSSLIELQLNLNYDLKRDANTSNYLVQLLQRTSQLRLLNICNNVSTIHSNMTIEDILIMIPKSIQHLKITIKNINDMKIIFDRLEYLSSIDFQFSSIKSVPSPRIIESFLKIRKDLTYRTDESSIQVWLNTWSEVEINCSYLSDVKQLWAVDRRIHEMFSRIDHSRRSQIVISVVYFSSSFVFFFIKMADQQEIYQQNPIETSLLWRCSKLK